MGGSMGCAAGHGAVACRSCDGGGFVVVACGIP